MSKESFKSFARLHPELATKVMNNESSWQKLYELYEIYGEDNSIWTNYFNESTPTTIKDIMNNFKNIDLTSVQKGISNLQKTLGIIQDIGVGQTTTSSLPYEKKPLYKYFED